MSNYNGSEVETKTCKQCNASFEITDKDLEFYEKVSPVFGGKKYSIPTPTLCQECRQQRRLVFRNERNLYKRKCDLSGKDIISMHSPNKNYKVYETQKWFGDSWDALEYGKNIDFEKTFFEQFESLLLAVPQISLISIGSENSDYNNFQGYNKNCYLSFDSGRNEDCSYLSRSYKNTKCFDLSYCLSCENSSNLIDCSECISSNFCIDSEKCFNSSFLWGCKSVSDCFMCTNLVNKKYCIYNKQYTKDEYNEELKNLKSISQEKLLEMFFERISKSIHKFSKNLSCENVLGDYMKNSKNSYFSFGSQETQDCKYLLDSFKLTDSYDDCFSGNTANLNLETIGCETPNRCRFCFSCWSGCDNLLYCYFCHSSKNCFGCVGLKNKEYCIFNKQYTKEEYEKLVPQIIEYMKNTGEWGEFFPINISLFGYNESLAQEYFPLPKKEILNKGFNWEDYEQPFPKVEKIIPADKLPDDIKDIPDDILNWAIECEITKKPFRIIAQELDFYRKHNIPVPKRHPDQRHLDRMALRNPRKLYNRKCDKCGKEIKTTYALDRSEIVYCEECYLLEIY